MTQQNLEPSGPSNIDLSARRPEHQPMFFYVGDCRTLPKLVRRGQLDTAIAAFVARALHLTQAQVSS